MIYGAKISGVSLKDKDNPYATWTKKGRQRTVGQLASLHAFVAKQNKLAKGARFPIGAIAVVGAGNGGFRGKELVETQDMDSEAADWIGLLGTFMNSMVVHTDLRKVPHRWLIAPGAEVRLSGMPRLQEATPANLRACLKAGELALIGCGSNRLDQSTDSAILDYLTEYRDVIGDDEAEAWKATEYGGVYKGDPAPFARQGLALPARFDEVTTGRIRAEGWTPVDPTCLDLIDKSGIPMRLHTMNADYGMVAAGAVGTLILPDSARVSA